MPATHPLHSAEATSRFFRTAVQTAALVVGYALLLIVALGAFHVSAIHTVMHLSFGVLGVALSRTFALARGYLAMGGVACLVVFAVGLLGPEHRWHAESWLDLGLGVAMITLGVCLRSTKDVVAQRHRITQVTRRDGCLDHNGNGE